MQQCLFEIGILPPLARSFQAVASVRAINGCVAIKPCPVNPSGLESICMIRRIMTRRAGDWNINQPRFDPVGSSFVTHDLDPRSSQLRAKLGTGDGCYPVDTRIIISANTENCVASHQYVGWQRGRHAAISDSVKTKPLRPYSWVCQQTYVKIVELFSRI